MTALMYAAPMLGLIGLGVAGIGLFGRDPAADVHDLTDYHEPALDILRERFIAAQKHGRPHVLPSAMNVTPRDILPPGRSVFAETAAALGMCPVDAGAVVAVVADRYGDNPADRAARMLREIAAVEQAKTAARDLLGAFPVVRAG